MAGVMLSAISSEISLDLEESLSEMKRLGMRWADLRFVGGEVNVAELTDKQLDDGEAIVKKYGFQVGCLVTPIAKVPIEEPWESEKKLLVRSLEVAKRLKAKYIRIFTYYATEGKTKAECRQPIMQRMKQLAQLAEAAGVTLLVENDGGLFGETVEECVDVFQTVNSPRLRMIYDPGNLIVLGIDPSTESLQKAKPYIDCIHVKDYPKGQHPGRALLAGQGDSQWESILRQVKAWNYSGLITLEPHQNGGNPAGKELFSPAHSALVQLLKKVGIPY